MYLPSAGRDVLAEYRAGHIPGAVFADLGWLSDPSAPFPHTLLGAEDFAQRMGALGIGNDDAVVVYDSSGQNFSAPRFWWMMRTFGHERVSVLDGGLKKWRQDGQVVTADPTPVEPQVFRAALSTDRVRDLAAMRDNLHTHAAQVVDARSPGRFLGQEPEPRAGVRSGHIPGSTNVHYATLVQADGTLRTAEELRTLMTAAGVDLSRPVVASCGTGVTACAVVLALDVLGVRDAAVYDGSWTEWGSTAG
jgi:thiosulfate/3-mercaptopyruvate sulfurtransferase